MRQLEQWHDQAQVHCMALGGRDTYQKLLSGGHKLIPILRTFSRIITPLYPKRASQVILIA